MHQNQSRVFRIASAAAVLLAGATASTAWADGYLELVSWDTLNAGGSSTSQFAHVIDGQSSFHQLTLNDSPRITRVDNLRGAQTASELVSTSDWVSAGGSAAGMSAIYGFSAVGGNLVFAESTTDMVWRVNQQSGAVSQYANQASILAATGGSSVQLLASFEVGPTGEVFFYEGASDSILATTGQNSVVTLISAAALTGLQGNSSVSGGLAIDATGSLYWASNTSDAMYKRASDGGLSQVLGTADITGVTGGTAAGFGDIFAAPDGFLYFYESSTDQILRFDPADPAASLSSVIGSAELLGGPAGSANVFQLGWYEGSLGFNVSGSKGVYVVPEPASAALLLIPGVAMLMRRRRA